MALRTNRWTASRSAPRSLTRLASFKPADSDFFLGPEDRRFEIDRQVIAQIITAMLPRAPLLPAGCVEHLAEQVTKNIAKVDRA
jgi:hypothetical protein